MALSVEQQLALVGFDDALTQQVWREFLRSNCESAFERPLLT